MSRIVRVAVTQTINAYTDMPASVEELDALAGRLDDIRAANLAHHETLIGRAASAGAHVIGLGELFASPYFAITRHPMWRTLAEDASSGPTVTAMRSLARTHHVTIVAPIYESAGEHRFDTAVVIDQTGEVLGKYRKTHIPEGANERGTFCETFYYGRSEGDLLDGVNGPSRNAFFPVFETAAARIGVAICYDRHFEGVVRTLASGGAELIFSPAVTFGAQSQRLWPIEFATDAARHGVFIAASNRKGQEPPWNVPFFGDSHVVGPAGRLPDLSSDDALVISDVDLDTLSGPSESGWNLRSDARPEIFD